MRGTAVADAVFRGDERYREQEQLLLQRIALCAAPPPPAGARALDSGESDNLPRCIGLSASAIINARHLDLATTARIRSYLYRYNTAPGGVRWRCDLASPCKVREYLLGTQRGTSADYISNSDEDEPSQGWWYWQRTGRRRSQADSLVHKLYVSPTCELTGLAFRASLDVLFSHEVLSFKVGCSAHGLLRPDKFVVYFHELDHLHHVASAIASRLQGIRAQAVPFTIPVSADGLLSRGIDPPKPRSVGKPWSWRALVTARIAKWLHASRGSLEGGGPDPHQLTPQSNVGGEHAN